MLFIGRRKEKNSDVGGNFLHMEDGDNPFYIVLRRRIRRGDVFLGGLVDSAEL